jgi:hypothetical protein
VESAVPQQPLVELGGLVGLEVVEGDVYVRSLGRCGDPIQDCDEVVAGVGLTQIGDDVAGSARLNMTRFLGHLITRDSV